MDHFARPLFGMAALLTAFAVAAEEPAPEPLRRQLGEHAFIPRLEVFDPFTTSDVASTSGFGYGTAGGPTFNLHPAHRERSTIITPTLSAAWSFAHGWGLLVNGSYTHSTVTANEDRVGVDQLQIQGAIDVDLKELGSIPMGFGLNVSSAYSVGDQKFRRYVYGLGIFYTGRKERWGWRWRCGERLSETRTCS